MILQKELDLTFLYVCIKCDEKKKKKNLPTPWPTTLAPVCTHPGAAHIHLT